MALQALKVGDLLPEDITQAILVTDTKGLVIDATRNDRALTISDEDYFKRRAKAPPGPIDLGVSEHQPAVGGVSLPVSRRIDGSNGEFSGIVAALIPPGLLTSNMLRANCPAPR